jgi:uncharacterized protein (TIRG00374 family)
MKGPLRAARFWFQLAATGGFVVLLAWRVDIPEALATIPEANWVWVVPALLIYTTSKAVHALRWRVFLGPDRNIPYSGLFGLFLISNMANAVLLLRAGDVLRIQSTSQRYNIPRSELTAVVIVVETLLDGLGFIVLIALAFSLGAIPDVLKAAFWAMAGLVLLGLILGMVASRYLSGDRLVGLYPFRWLSPEALIGMKSLVGQFVDGLRTLRDPSIGIPAVGLSLIGWCLEGMAFWCFGQAFELGLDVPSYFLIMITANFAVSIPITPSGFGPFEVATQELVVALGAGAALATGFAIGTHLSLVIWVTLTGLVAMWIMRLTPDEIFYLSQERDTAPQAGAS